jgi:hypothetical protein
MPSYAMQWCFSLPPPPSHLGVFYFLADFSFVKSQAITQ